mgnify:CR=1 FL=1
MQNASSETGRLKPALKYVLAAFVVISIGAAVYKAMPCCSGGGAAAAAPAPAAVPAAAPVLPAAPGKAAAAETGRAVVYYFYTDTRCASCKTIEAYTREAVTSRLAGGYKGLKAEFVGVNVDEESNAHYVLEYGLSSKSVVVQRFSGDKRLNWRKLDKVWQLLGDKEAFLNYVAGETRLVIDGK